MTKNEHELGRKIGEAFGDAARDAVAGHHAAGRSVPGRIDGVFGWLHPDGSFTKEPPSSSNP